MVVIAVDRWADHRGVCACHNDLRGPPYMACVPRQFDRALAVHGQASCGYDRVGHARYLVAGAVGSPRWLSGASTYEVQWSAPTCRAHAQPSSGHRDHEARTPANAHAPATRRGGSGDGRRGRGRPAARTAALISLLEDRAFEQRRLTHGDLQPVIVNESCDRCKQPLRGVR